MASASAEPVPGHDRPDPSLIGDGNARRGVFGPTRQERRLPQSGRKGRAWLERPGGPEPCAPFAQSRRRHVSELPNAGPPGAGVGLRSRGNRPPPSRRGVNRPRRLGHGRKVTGWALRGGGVARGPETRAGCPRSRAGPDHGLSGVHSGRRWRGVPVSGGSLVFGLVRVREQIRLLK